MARTPNNTQGQDFVVLPLDKIRGEETLAAAGDDLNMQGGAGATGLAGGHVFVNGGPGDGAGFGGNVTLTPGTGGTPGSVVLAYATWPAADAAGVLTSNGAGVLSWGSRMQEIRLTPMNVDMAPGVGTANPLVSAAGIDGAAALVESAAGQRQLLQFFKSTENDGAAAWSTVLPTTYSGNGLTVEVSLTGDGSPSAAADFDGQFERQQVGFNLDAASSFAAAISATGDTIDGFAGTTVLATMVFTNAQINGLLAGENFRFAVVRRQSDSYSGLVRMTTGRIYETP